MPKRRKRAASNKTDDDDQSSEEEEDIKNPPAYSLTEVCDVSILESLVILQEFSLEQTQVARAMLNKFRKAARTQHASAVIVKYKYPANMAHHRCGRVYAYPSIQGLKGEFTRLCCHEFYRDVDVRRCAPTCLLHIATTYLQMRCPTLETYVADPTLCIQQIKLKNHCVQHAPDEMFKKAFNVVMHGGSYETVLREFDIDPAHPVAEFETFHNEVNRIATAAMESETFFPLYSVVRDKPNSRGSFIGMIWQKIEGEILESLFHFFQSTNFKPGVLKHDGMLVRSKEAVPPDVMRLAEAHVFQTTSIRIHLVEKPMEPSKEEWDLLASPFHLHMIKDTTDAAIQLVLRHAYNNNCVRLTTLRGVEIMTPHPNVPGAFKTMFTDYARSLEMYVNHVLHCGGLTLIFKMKPVIDYLKSADSKMCRLLYDKDFRSDKIVFRNGCLTLNGKLRSMDFQLWSDIPTPTWKTRHYFDQDLPGSMQDDMFVPCTETPVWDEMVGFQLDVRLPTGEVDIEQRRFLEACLGRLNFEVGELDNWQVAPHMIGDRNTGKSTILKIVSRMYPGDLTSSINGTFEPKFGYAALTACKCIVSPDTPENLQDYISAQSFQSMISGDKMSIAVKFGTAHCIDWKVPTIWASNSPPGFNDKHCAIERRVFYFLCSRLVQSRDTTLFQKILENELATIFVRCVAEYFALLERVQHHDIWEHVPAILQKNANALSAFTNPLESFLQNGNDWFQIIYEVGAITKLEDLEQAYSNYMQFGLRRQKGARIGRDYHPLTKNGYLVEQRRLCKICDQPASVLNCGDHYNKNNRRNVWLVINMRLLRKKDNDNNSFHP